MKWKPESESQKMDGKDAISSSMFQEWLTNLKKEAVPSSKSKDFTKVEEY